MDYNKQFLIYYKGAAGNHGGHAAVYFACADNLFQAVLQFLLNQNNELKVNEDGSLREGAALYPHPLAYVETWYKTSGEWQIRELPEWTLQQAVSEVFCGESDDGPAEIIALCRRELHKRFSRSRARAFVWYLRQGTLVTFYRKGRPNQIEIVQHYLWDWNGHTEKLEALLTQWGGCRVFAMPAIPANARPRKGRPLLPTPASRRDHRQGFSLPASLNPSLSRKRICSDV